MNAMDRRRTVVRRRVGRKRAESRKKLQGPGQDRRRLVQLLVSLALFLLVFVGRGVFPDQIQVWRRVLTSDVDFHAVFQQFQQSLSEGSGIQSALSQLGASVLGRPAQTSEPERPESLNVTMLSQTSRLGLDYVSQAGVMEKAAADSDQPETSEPVQEPQPEATPEIVTAVAQAYTDDGIALPSNVSFTHYELGLEETACQSLAQALMEQWAARWPGDRYTMAPYDQIQAGLRNAIMGIELRR